MATPCVRIGCANPALAAWWSLCASCTAPLLDPVPGGDAGGAASDQQASAGWEALAWAERIAPRHWGNAAPDDGWVTSVRCLVVAAVVTGRADGCVHTRTDGATPVVAVPRATGVLRCPTCAEGVVAAVTTDGRACDRCGAVAVTAADRVAAVVGTSLLIVAQLCNLCRPAVLAMSDVVADDG